MIDCSNGAPTCRAGSSMSGLSSGDSKAEELAFWQERLALTEAGSKARIAVKTNIYQLEKQLAVQGERDALSMLDADEKVSNAIYARKRAAIQADAELGKVSANQELASCETCSRPNGPSTRITLQKSWQQPRTTSVRGKN